MKNIIYLLSGLSLFLLLNFTTPTSKKEIKVVVTLSNCKPADSLFLYEFNGVNFTTYKTAKRKEIGKFVFEIPKTNPRFYYVGTEMGKALPVILGSEGEISLTGSCKEPRQMKILNSPLNEGYAKLKLEMQEQRKRTGQLVQDFRRARNNEDQRKVVEEKMAEQDKEKQQLLNDLNASEPYLAKALALNTYLSYANNGAQYNNEVEYFINEYFQFANWKDEDYGYLPWVYESTKAYTETLSSINLDANSHQLFLNNLLKNIPENSRTYRLALGGIIAALNGKTHPNYVPFAEQFVAKYKKEAPEAVAAINAQLKKAKSFMIGGEAPDFSQNTPDGETISLKDLRGKVVLVDFWASWCGPCRKENPNVVRLFNQYKDKGFDIIGVSLDNNKDRWLKAIEKDKLTWHHVSDLKGWKNEVAQAYGVRSIPQTLLLDKEGKIIARNLRGPALEAKLAELFQEN